MYARFSAQQLYSQMGLPRAPLVVDARSDNERRAHGRVIPGAIVSEPCVQTWIDSCRWPSGIIIYTQQVEERAEGVCRRLALGGHRPYVLAGGMNDWLASGYPTLHFNRRAESKRSCKWITREHPKIDGLACAWFIKRFIDPMAQFRFAPMHLTDSYAESLDAQPFGVPGTKPENAPSAFDGLIRQYGLRDPVVDQLAEVVRAADSASFGAAPEAAGLFAFAVGLAVNISDDGQLVEDAIHVYDALYAWHKITTHDPFMSSASAHEFYSPGHSVPSLLLRRHNGPPRT